MVGDVGVDDLPDTTRRRRRRRAVVGVVHVVAAVDRGPDRAVVARWPARCRLRTPSRTARRARRWAASAGSTRAGEWRPGRRPRCCRSTRPRRRPRRPADGDRLQLVAVGATQVGGVGIGQAGDDDPPPGRRAAGPGVRRTPGSTRRRRGCRRPGENASPCGWVSPSSNGRCSPVRDSASTGRRRHRDEQLAVRGPDGQPGVRDAGEDGQRPPGRDERLAGLVERGGRGPGRHRHRDRYQVRAARRGDRLPRAPDRALVTGLGPVPQAASRGSVTRAASQGGDPHEPDDTAATGPSRGGGAQASGSSSMRLTLHTPRPAARRRGLGALRRAARWPEWGPTSSVSTTAADRIRPGGPGRFAARSASRCPSRSPRSTSAPAPGLGRRPRRQCLPAEPGAVEPGPRRAAVRGRYADLADRARQPAVVLPYLVPARLSLEMLVRRPAGRGDRTPASRTRRAPRSGACAPPGRTRAS